jgi:hypothetical protein
MWCRETLKCCTVIIIIIIIRRRRRRRRRRVEFTYFLPAEKSFCEANQFSASQEILRILWNSKVHYRIHKCPPPVPIPRQLDPVHTLKSHFLKIHLNIILPSTPGSPK